MSNFTCKSRVNISFIDGHQDAALDAQASLEVYMWAKEKLQNKCDALGKPIPEDWYTYNFLEGKATRLQRSIRMEDRPWAQNLCQWYQAGRFHQYYM